MTTQLFNRRKPDTRQMQLGDQMDLLEQRYPHAAGYRRTETSRDAATSIGPSRTTAHKMILANLTSCPGTPDEVADFFGWSVLYTRPRLSELKRLGLIRPTGTRRTNASGKSADVLEVCK